MIERLSAEFTRRFGGPEVCWARAPGRVNLIGEHTDYSGGLALPCAIEPSTWVLAAPSRGSSGQVRVWSEALGEARFDPARPEWRGAWSDYVAGAFAVCGEAAGEPLPAIDLVIGSDVPLGAGLSSSAALEVALVFALSGALGRSIGAREAAERAHRVETEFVGVPCGVMDQLASACCEGGHALRIDCRSGELRAVPIAAEVALLVVQSGVERALADGRYAARVAECAAALERVRAVLPAATSLRDVDPQALGELEPRMPAVPFRRLRHVVTENARVDAFAAALAAADLPAAGAQKRAGMASLREDFEVSVPELDTLCALGDEVPGCFGSRLTGAGFGGCTLHLVDPAAAQDVAAHIRAGFERHHGRRPATLQTTPAPGAELRAPN